MRARITGLGQWLPEQVRPNAEWPSEFSERSRASSDRELIDIPDDADVEDRLALENLAREARDPFLGSARRRIAARDVCAGQAEAWAGRAALDDAGVDPRDLDAIISWSMVPELPSPGSGPKVAALLGADRAQGYSVDSACASAIAQLEIAAALIESGRARCVLLTQSHLLTRAFALMHPASPNIGDAATALVVQAGERPGVRNVWARSHGEYWDAVVWTRGRKDESHWYEPGGGFCLGSKQPGAAQKLIADTVRFGADTVRQLLAAARVSPGDVDALCAVQPRGWVPAAIAEAVGIPRERAPDTFADTAHLGGVGAVSNLYEARRRGLLKPGAKVVLYAQGAGFTRAASLVEW